MSFAERGNQNRGDYSKVVEREQADSARKVSAPTENSRWARPSERHGGGANNDDDGLPTRSFGGGVYRNSNDGERDLDGQRGGASGRFGDGEARRGVFGSPRGGRGDARFADAERSGPPGGEDHRQMYSARSSIFGSSGGGRTRPDDAGGRDAGDRPRFFERGSGGAQPAGSSTSPREAQISAPSSRAPPRSGAAGPTSQETVTVVPTHVLRQRVDALIDNLVKDTSKDAKAREQNSSARAIAVPNALTALREAKSAPKQRATVVHLVVKKLIAEEAADSALLAAASLIAAACKTSGESPTPLFKAEQVVAGLADVEVQLPKLQTDGQLRDGFAVHAFHTFALACADAGAVELSALPSSAAHRASQQEASASLAAAASGLSAEASRTMLREILATNEVGDKLAAAALARYGSGPRPLGSLALEAVLEHVASKAEGNVPDKTNFESEGWTYAPLLTELLGDASDAEQLKAVYVAQQFAHKMKAAGGDKALVLAIFVCLYDADVLPEEAFMAWKDDLSDDVPPGKMDAIIATTSWFSYLEEESEDDSDEESDSDEE